MADSMDDILLRYLREMDLKERARPRRADHYPRWDNSNTDRPTTSRFIREYQNVPPPQEAEPTLMERLEAERDRYRRKFIEQQQQLIKANRENDRLRQHVRQADMAANGYLARVRALERELRGMGRASTNPASDLPVEDLIKLCHPDRHPPGLRVLANRITAELLKRRKK